MAASSGRHPSRPATTRLYLSGEQADKIKNLFTGTGLDPRITAGPATAASAVKMAYAAWTKGTAALAPRGQSPRSAEGVEDALLAEWALSQPQLADQSGRAALLGRHEGLALGRRDGGDRPVHGRGRPAGRIPPGGRRDLPPLPAHCPAPIADDDVLREVIAAITRLTAQDRESCLDISGRFHYAPESSRSANSGASYDHRADPGHD